MPIVLAVCGGGSLAHAVAGIAAADSDVEVRILTRRPDDWSTSISVTSGDVQVIGTPAVISSDPAQVIPHADVVALAVPSCARAEVLRRIAPFVERDQWVGSLPGFGGFDWLARSILGDAPRLFGTQRVPFVCAKTRYGHAVEVTGIRPQTFVAALPSRDVEEIARLLRRLLNVPVVPMGNYLCVALSPSNAIFHPARVYSFFRDWTPETRRPTVDRFYDDWDDRATEVFGALDADVQRICRALPLDMAYVKPIVQHYEVPSLAHLTAKIRSIRALSGRPLPLTRNGDGFQPDLGAYYFTEDLPYGLAVVRGIADVAGVATPAVDEVLAWGERILDMDLRHNAQLPLPRNFGIDSLEELVRRASA